MDDEAEAAGGTADLLERGVGDPDARPAIDEEELTFERCQARRLLGENRAQHRPHAKLLGAVAFQLGLHAGAFNHLDPDATVGDVLRRHDRPAQMKAVCAVEIADRAGDRGEVGLRDLLSEIGLIGCGDAIAGNGLGAADIDPAQHELWFRIPACVGPADRRQRDRRTAQRFLLGLVFKVFLGLPRIEAGLVRLLSERLRNSRENRCRQHQCNEEMPLLNARSELLTVV